MLNVQEFTQLVAVERKLERGEPLTPEEQVFAKKYKAQGPKLCGHNGCTNRLGPRVDGEHHQINKKDVCDDCYYRAFDDLETTEGLPEHGGFVYLAGYPHPIRR